ncbi:MAG TPA: FAD-dependent oxidoreductase, partial [Chthoniobacteraceae bacterium]
TVFTGFARGETIETEICIYGGTAAGVAAACTAERLGHGAVLVEFGRHVGGLTSGGLGWTDIGNKAAIGGFSRTFYKRLGKHYGKDEAWTFEPHVAEEELHALLSEAKVPLYLQQRLASVKKDGARIMEIAMENGNVFRAKMFIDCSYEGDLMAKAGVRYLVGRESNAQFGETLNGVRAQTPAHQFLVPVDPYVHIGDPASGLLPFVQKGSGAAPGEGDHCVQAYNFRLCLTKNPQNKRPIEPPPGYDPARYELLGRYFDALAAAGRTVSIKNFLKIDMVTPEKTDINNNGGFSTDYIGENYAYPDADYATREKIWKAHEDYTRGFLTFLATDGRVPLPIRSEIQSWGLCKDEFTDTAGWPYQLYVREARRMLGEMVMTEKVCRGLEKPEDSIGLGAYNMDSHNCERVVREGRAENEGDVQVGVKPYPVSYRAIVPKADECTNLWSPVCLSATHIAYGSIRMEPVFMILGQSAATAASQAIESNTTAQKVDYAKLRQQLLADGQVLEWNATKAAENSANPAVKWDGIILTIEQAEKTGEWKQGSLADPRGLGAGYIHDDNTDKGRKSLSWTPDLPAPGKYEIFLHFLPNANRATNVPVTIEVVKAARTIKVDERNVADGLGAVSLGVFILPKGKETSVAVSNEGTDGYVVVDGIRLVERNK